MLQDVSKITEDEFHKISSLIHEIAGINLKSSKKTLLSNRLRSRVSKKGFSSFTEYYDYIKKTNDKKEIGLMLNAVSTNETYFFRNTKHFETLIDFIIPELISRVTPPIRIWSAGCSSGEEAYTLAMLLDEKGWMRNDLVSIKASDINTEVLEEAARGIYDENRLRITPERYKNRYFQKIGKSNYKLNERIKDFVHFEKLNLVNSPFNGHYELILCRNVMIYFSREDQIKVVGKFYNAAVPGGYFIIGHSESLFFINNEFEFLKVGEAPVYRR